MEQEIKKSCPICSYKLVLKDYGEPEIKDCYLSNEDFLDKNNNQGICIKKYYCGVCDKFVN